jgi:hypothetical protein
LLVASSENRKEAAFLPNASSLQFENKAHPWLPAKKMPNFSETLDFLFLLRADVVVGLLCHHATNVAPRPPVFIIAKYHLL